MYAAAQDHTKVIADAIATRLREHGFVVEVGNARAGCMPPPEDYDGVVLGAPVGGGSDKRLIATYIHHNREGLAGVPSVLFTVGGFFERLVGDLHWSPDFAAAFALHASWSDIRRFADEIARAVAGAAVTADRTQPHVMDR